MEFDSLTFPEVPRVLDSHPLFILPVGIVEEHGPHLPLSTDSILAEWTAREVGKRWGNTLLLPSLRFGVAWSTRPYPGTISLSFDTLRTFARDLVEEIDRMGGRKLLVLSGHAGSSHLAALTLGAREARRGTAGVEVFVLTDWEILSELRGTVVAGVPIPPDDGHAGTMETARLLAIAPSLLRAPLPPPTPSPPKTWRVGVDSPPHPSGILGGDPSRATPELGSELNEIVLSRLLDLLKEIDPERGKSPPRGA